MVQETCASALKKITRKNIVNYRSIFLRKNLKCICYPLHLQSDLCIIFNVRDTKIIGEMLLLLYSQSGLV